MREEVRQKIDSLINGHPVVLFMKGTKDHPQCGFSKQVVDILNRLVANYITIDVLANPEIREGIKEYSSWPTVPQLYIHHEFAGGCDIVLDLFRNNQLQNLLKIEKAVKKPAIKLSKSALDAFKSVFLDRQDNEFIRIIINANFEHGLSFDKKQDDDFSYTFEDIELVIDPYSALRAKDLLIDYLTQDLDAGFIFENPNEFKAIKELTVEELKSLQEQDKEFLLLDVRPESERNLAKISFAKPLDEITKEEIAKLNKEQLIIFHCHHGQRSKTTAASWRDMGFLNVYNLNGGIDAWSKKVDSKIPIY
jgi:monothiol glutaredoxin